VSTVGEIADLEQYGALRLLLELDEKQRFITELIRRSTNPEGIMSQDALKNLRWSLSEKGLGLIKEEMEEGPRPRTYLVITDKGRRVAQKIREIQEVLEEE